VPVIFTLIILMCTEITEEKILENRFIRNIISKAFKPIVILFEFISDFEINDFFRKTKRENKMKRIKTYKK